MLETARSSERPLIFYQTTRRHSPEGSPVCSHRRELGFLTSNVLLFCRHDCIMSSLTKINLGLKIQFLPRNPFRLQTTVRAL